MVKAGMTLGEAMSALSTQKMNGRLKKIAGEVAAYLHSGGCLSDGFARYPWMFAELHIDLLRAGESSGTTDRILDRIARQLEWDHSIRQKLRLATLYPKILVLAVIFIPKFSILIFKGFAPYMHATVGIVLPVVGALILLWALYRILYQIAGFRHAVDLVKISIPKIGNMVRMLALARFYRTMGALYAAGAPVSKALLHGARSCGNEYLSRGLQKAIPDVEHGRSVYESLKRTQVLPDMALNMLQTGERTGDVDQMLEKTADYTESEAEVAVLQSTVILGALLLLGIAAYIGYTLVQFYSSYASSVNVQ
jgi:type II secretory pathway component PulF